MFEIQIVCVCALMFLSALEIQAIHWLKMCLLVKSRGGPPNEVSEALGLIEDSGGMETVKECAELQLTISRGLAIVLLLVISSPLLDRVLVALSGL